MLINATISAQDLMSALEKTGAHKKKQKPHGAHRRCNAKLTPDQVKEIMDRRDRKGMSVTKIAQEMNLPHARVKGVVDGGCGTRTVLV